jgi:hypothetical protein
MTAEERSASVEGVIWDLRAKNDSISPMWLIREDWLFNLVLGHRDSEEDYQIGTAHCIRPGELY